MKKIIIFLSALSLSILPIQADCGPTLQMIGIQNVEMKHHSDVMNISFTLDFSDVNLGKNQQIIYTPILQSRNGLHQITLDKIVLNGRNVDLREQRLRKNETGINQTVVRKNGTVQTISFTGFVVYEKWMKNCKLTLSEDLCGCGEVTSQNTTEIFTITPPQRAPEQIRAFVEPEIENPKIRHAKGSAYVDYVVNRTEINPNYRDNKAEINKILSTIDLVRKDKNVEITDIEIHGFASPEGNYEHNKFLAETRAKSLTDYVKGLTTISPSVFHVASTPEDWGRLISYIKDSDLADKEGILEIATDDNLSPDEKEKLIKSNFNESYNYMLKTWYPSLRRSDYSIGYRVRPFSPEEALEIIRVSPKDVSVYEMFCAAQTLGVGTKEYNDIIKLAVKTYPNDPVANYNAAAVAVNEEDYQNALKYLSKVKETPLTQNMRGVIYLNNNEFEKAEQCFRTAAESGLEVALENLKKLEQIKEEL